MFVNRMGISLLLLALTGVRAAAQQAPPSPAAQPQTVVTVKPQPFSDQLRKTVVFLTVYYTKPDEVKPEDRSRSLSGTGFLVSYRDERLGTNLGFTYLVTNRHMAIPGVEHGLNYSVEHYCLRMNFTPAPASNPCGPVSKEFVSYQWFYPDDDSVDLAVAPLNIIQSSADYMTIPYADIVTRQTVKDKQIAPGDQVIFAGYFYQFPGKDR
jgi:hypothetical protein